MTYQLLHENRPRARKRHTCIWCGEDIEKGEQYHYEQSIYDGNFQNHHWHLECQQIAVDEWFPDDEQFMPYEHPRGAIGF